MILVSVAIALAVMLFMLGHFILDCFREAFERIEAVERWASGEADLAGSGRLLRAPGIPLQNEVPSSSLPGAHFPRSEP